MIPKYFLVMIADPGSTSPPFQRRRGEANVDSPEENESNGDSICARELRLRTGWILDVPLRIPPAVMMRKGEDDRTSEAAALE
jgi:hypothetical protein